MNTVEELRQVLSSEVERLQPPVGLETRILQKALRSSMAVVPVHRAKRHRAVRSWESRSIQAPRLMALVAALLAVAVVLSLVFAARALHIVGSVPAGGGPVGQAIVLNNVDFQCTLPVVIDDYPRVFEQVHLPGGLVVNKSIAALPADQKQPPALAADTGGFPIDQSYDLQMGQWVPVPRGWISPDGRSWAYQTGRPGEGGGGSKGTVHIVDVATGTDRRLWSGDGGAWLLGFLSSGVYFFDLSGTQSRGFWVVDPARPGSAHKVGPLPETGAWDASSVFGPLGGFALAYDSKGYPVGVVNIDLSGNVTTWFTSAVGLTRMALLGLDAQGRPVIETDTATPQDRVLLLTAPNHFVEIASGPHVFFGPSGEYAVTGEASGDSHGVWFGELGSIWLYQPATGLREVFALPPSLFAPHTPKPGASSPPPGASSWISLTVVGPCK